MTRNQALEALIMAAGRCGQLANQEKMPASLMLEYSDAARNFAEAAAFLEALPTTPARRRSAAAAKAPDRTR